MKPPSPGVVASTRLFRNGNSQAVRIPKALAFDDTDMEVEIERRGDELIVRPAKRRLTGLGDAFRKLGPHFRGFVREPPGPGPAGPEPGAGPTRRTPGTRARMKYMLDTSVCVCAILGGSERLDRRFGACETGDLVMSAVTLGELEVGLARSGDPDLARSDAADVLSAVTVAPFDEAAARSFGRIRATPSAGRGVHDRLIADLLIAAHAVSLGVVLVTDREQDFSDIPGLVVENWALPLPG